MTKLLNIWRKLGPFTRAAILAIPLFVILFTALCLNTDWDDMATTEEDYEALESVAYEIIESKNIVQPLNEKLEHYDVSFNSDGTIDITLYGTSENVSLVLSKDFEIKRFNRGASVVILIVIVCAIIIFAISWFAMAVVYGIVVCIKKAYLYFKN